MRSSVPWWLHKSRYSKSVLRGGRSFGIARHWHPVLKIYMIPFITSRTSTWRLLPPRLAGGINGSTCAHSSSVRSTLGSSGNFTMGHITALEGLSDDTRLLQIQAPIQPGNSGGPVLDEYGNVSGVVVSKLDELKIAGETQSLPQMANFAIKAAVVLNFLEARGARPTAS